MHAMIKIRTRQLIVALCALFLIGAQQAAFAHLIDHFSLAAKAVTQPGNEGGHGAPSSLSHVCTTCLAFAALAAAAPPSAQLPVVAAVLTEPPHPAEFPHALSSARLPYAARAPPALL